MPVRLIADDAAAAPAIDSAIDALIDIGVLDGVAVFANFGGLPRCRTWCERGVSVGIHLNLSTGPPVLPAERVQSLLGPSGHFSDPRDQAGSDPTQLLESYRSTQRGRIEFDELVDEFSAQAAAFEAALGQRPRFVSVHHDLDVMEVVRRAADSAVPHEMCRQSRLESGLLSVYEYELHSPHATVGGIGNYFCEVLSSLDREVDAEVICHPAASVEGLNSMTIYCEQRVKEYHALQTPPVLKALSSTRQGE